MIGKDTYLDQLDEYRPTGQEGIRDSNILAIHNLFKLVFDELGSLKQKIKELKKSEEGK